VRVRERQSEEHLQGDQPNPDLAAGNHYAARSENLES
jgi:hypothetical protein